jgi:ribonuclease VapC
MSLLNLGEIAYLVERRYGTDQCERTLNALRAFPIALENVTLDRILAAAHVKARHAISYADAFAAALAQEMGATVVAGDPEFEQVESLVNVDWLGSTAE